MPFLFSKPSTSFRPVLTRSSPLRHILAGAIAVLVPTALPAAGIVRIWDATDNAGNPTGNNNFYSNLNWDGDTRPTFSGNSDAYLFDGAGSAVNININAGLTEYLAKNIEFTSGAYTFTGAQNLTLGDATLSPLNTGYISNRSTGTQNFNGSGRIAFSFGGVNAEAGNVTFGNNHTIEIGNNSAGAERNLNITGAFNITINSVLSGLGTDTSAGGAIIKTGTGRLQIQAESSTWAGRIETNEGVIRINKGLALGSTEGQTYIAGGNASSLVEFTGNISVPETFRLAGRTNTAPQLGNFSGNNTLIGSIQLDAGGSRYGLDSTAGTLTLNGGVAFGTGSGPSTLQLSGSGNGVIDGAIGSTGDSIAIVKMGLGAWTLNGANPTTGPITVSQGSLNIGTAHSGGGAITVSDGATLGVNLITENPTLVTSALELGSATGATLVMDLGSNAGPAPVISAESLSIAASTINVRGSLTVGQFPLIDYNGIIGGSGFGGFTLGTLPLRAIGSLLHDEAQSRLVLDITAFDSPKWTGNLSSDWDFDETSSGGLPGTDNWREINSGLTTKYIQGPDGTDQVLFDDTASRTDVNLLGDLSPAIVTVDNTTKNYIFAGTGRLTGPGKLVTKGTGTLTLANFGVNDYTGTTSIGLGSTLQIGDGVNDGAGSIGNGSIINDGTLVLSRPDSFALSTPISGNGAIVKRTGGTATISGNNEFDGLVTIEAGTLRLGNANALGSTNEGTIVRPGATLDANGQRTPAEENVLISGAGVGDSGALVNNGSGNIFVGFRSVTLTGPAAFGGTARFDIRDGEDGLDAAGHTLTKVGSNSIFLANIGETHIGQLLISGGRVAFEGSATFGDQPGAIVVESGAELGLEDSQVIHTKPIILQDGTINTSAGTQNEIASPILMDVLGTVRTAANTTTLITGLISGDADFAKTGTGTLVLAGNNTFTGRTTVNQGTLRVGNDGPSGSLSSDEISLEPASDQTATLAFRRSDTELTVNNIISSQGLGTNVLNIGATSGTVPATAIVTLGGNNSFTGNVNINGGSLRITNSSALGIGPKTISIASNNKPSLRLKAAGEAIDLSPDLSFVTSNDDPSYPTIFNEVGNNTIRGTISLNTGNGGNTRVSVAAGSSLTLTGAIAPAATSTQNRTLLLDGAGTGQITGVVSDLAATPRFLSLVKQGSGTWTLDSNSTYTGETTIQTGTFKLGSSGRIDSSALIAIWGGATFDVSDVTNFTVGSNRTLRGAGNIVGSVISDGAIINPTETHTIGTLPISGNLQLGEGSRVLATIGAPGASDLISVGSNLTFSGASTIELLPTGLPLSGSYQLFSYQGALDQSAGSLSVLHNMRYSIAVDSSTPQQINLFVTGSAANLIWAGDGVSNLWNRNSAPGWNAGSEKFFDLDTVTFDDTSANRNVTIEGTLTPSAVNVNAASDYTFSGSGGIAGASGGFIKEGSGTVILGTANTYTGSTQVNAGTLLVTGSINGSTVTVGAGATLGGTGSITTNNQPLSVAAGGFLAPGTSVGTLTINTGTSTLDLAGAFGGTAALQFELGVTNASDRITLSGGSLNIGTGVLDFDDFQFTSLSGFGPGVYTLIQTSSSIIGTLNPDLGSLTGFIGGQEAYLGFGDNNTDLILNVVPEPGTASMLVLGVTVLGLRRRHR